MTIKTPNYCLTEDCHIPSNDRGDGKVLEAGTWVRPIDPYYIPKHVKEDDRWPFFDENTQIFCYTRYGIVPLPKRILRER
jgi:hypothetical protein